MVVFVCLFVFLSVHGITYKVIDGLHETSTRCMSRDDDQGSYFFINLCLGPCNSKLNLAWYETC